MCLFLDRDGSCVAAFAAFLNLAAFGGAGRILVNAEVFPVMGAGGRAGFQNGEHFAAGAGTEAAVRCQTVAALELLDCCFNTGTEAAVNIQLGGAELFAVFVSVDNQIIDRTLEPSDRIAG